MLNVDITLLSSLACCTAGVVITVNIVNVSVIGELPKLCVKIRLDS